MSFIRFAASAAALAFVSLAGLADARAAAADYRFEALGKPQPSTEGKSVVSVWLVLAAKVQGEAETVRGAVTVELPK